MYTCMKRKATGSSIHDVFANAVVIKQWQLYVENNMITHRVTLKWTLVGVKNLYVGKCNVLKLLNKPQFKPHLGHSNSRLPPIPRIIKEDFD